LCAGFGAAAHLAQAADNAHVERLWQAAWRTLGSGWILNGSGEQRYRGNLNIRREGLDAGRLLGELRNLAFSLGSACGSGSGRPSHVLRALGLTGREARSSLRIGFGRYTEEEELVTALQLIDDAANAQAKFAA
jgi:cysteine desulfurase